MEKQFNARLSLPVLIDLCKYLEDQTFALQKFLEKFSEKDINQLLPNAIQSYLKSKQFDQEVVAEAREVLEKCKPNFLNHLKKCQNECKKLGKNMNIMFSKLYQTKENIKKGKLHSCQICGQGVAYPTAMGLHYHKVSQHSDLKTEKCQTESKKTSSCKTKEKKIRKQRRKPKEQDQAFDQFEGREQNSKA